MNKCVFCLHNLTNFGDMLNIPLFRHYFKGEVTFVTQYAVSSGEPIVVGMGTLIDHIIPAQWFYRRQPILLGTGAAKLHRKTPLQSKGFVRGKLTAEKTGIKAIGDLGILVDRIYKSQTRRDKTAIVVDKFFGEVNVDLPNPERFDATTRNLAQVEDFYNKIAESRFVLTDRLHIATTAESLGIPWVIWNHGEHDLFYTGHKFNDWAGMIDKEKFIIKDLSEVNLIEENVDFEKSAKQKDFLEEEIRGVTT